MFTGIIETLGRVQQLQPAGSGQTIWVATSFSGELRVDQSIALNGVCLTVEEIGNNAFRATAIKETLEKTNLGSLKTGMAVNLERCLQLNGRLDGHIVQGHVDTTAECTEKQDLGGSWEFRFRYPKKFGTLIIEKGSICIDGISLTAFNVTDDAFSVGIIPYTFEHTNIRNLNTGMNVNIEFDLIGKYITRFETLKPQH